MNASMFPVISVFREKVMKVGDLENNLFKTVYACISLDGYTSRSLEIIRVVDPPLGLRGSGVGAQA